MGSTKRATGGGSKEGMGPANPNTVPAGIEETASKSDDNKDNEVVSQQTQVDDEHVDKGHPLIAEESTRPVGVMGKMVRATPRPAPGPREPPRRSQDGIEPVSPRAIRAWSRRSAEPVPGWQQGLLRGGEASAAERAKANLRRFKSRVSSGKPMPAAGSAAETQSGVTAYSFGTRPAQRRWGRAAATSPRAPAIGEGLAAPTIGVPSVQIEGPRAELIAVKLEGLERGEDMHERRVSSGLMRAATKEQLRAEQEQERSRQGGVMRAFARGLRGVGGWVLRRATPESVRLWGGFL